MQDQVFHRVVQANGVVATELKIQCAIAIPGNKLQE